MINVMIVDDSAVVRSVIGEMVGRQPDMRVLGSAADPLFALRKMRAEWPDVLVLDVEMPRMDGLTFLRQLMRERPTPTIVCSSLTTAGAEATLRAFDAGAVCVIGKPARGLSDHLNEQGEELLRAVRAAAVANLARVRPDYGNPTASHPRGSAAVPTEARAGSTLIRTTERVIAIGTSTGGTQALERVLTQLPAHLPGIAIVQHMPAQFTRAFAARLDRLCAIQVKEAEPGDCLIAGRALIAPGGRHMVVLRNGARYVVDVVDGPPVSRHRPSADVLFRSVARAAGRNALGVIMTGMGDDGARGLRELHDTGADTVAQDEESCVVFGMPKEAIRLGGVRTVLHLDDIPDAMLRHATAR